MAFVVGVLCAANFGMETHHSASSNGDKSAVGTTQTIIGLGLLLLGFFLGAPFGGLIGVLWGRKGLVGALGFGLVTLTGGLAGLTMAGLLGAQTRVTVSGNSVSMEHGATTPVLIGGAALGLVLGALGAWWFSLGMARQSCDTEPVRPQG
jgi:hypothetical protein